MEEFPEKYLNENHENLKRVLEKYFFGLEGKICAERSGKIGRSFKKKRVQERKMGI